LRYSSDEEIRTLAVTSALLGDGKSTIATNLAIAIAGMTKGGALLVDADLRRPTIHHRLGIDDSVRGFSDVLIGSLRLEDAVLPTKHKGLSVLPAGSPVPNSMRLFQTERFERICDEMRDRFPFVIIDTPALMSVFDGTFVASKADGTIIVVAAGHTDARSTNRAIDRLRSFSTSNLLGIVLNQVPPAARQYGYYHQPRQPITIKDSITPPTHDSITTLLSDDVTPPENGAASETAGDTTLPAHAADEASDVAVTPATNGKKAARNGGGVAPPSDEVTPVS
jgi:capsular exopolysaccharide synthesis family protein